MFFPPCSTDQGVVLCSQNKLWEAAADKSFGIWGSFNTPPTGGSQDNYLSYSLCFREGRSSNNVKFAPSLFVTVVHFKNKLGRGEQRKNPAQSIIIQFGQSNRESAWSSG